MRRQAPISTLLYNHIYPEPKQGDPPNFSTHLAKNLVPEVRIEVNTYYGDLNSAEARYPGLNYCHAAHRMRLGRFPHHKRLFDAFDELKITESEIMEFCNWEGTKSARERYEKDEGITVHDTTGDEIGAYRDPREFGVSEIFQRRCSIVRKTEISVIVEDRRDTAARRRRAGSEETGTATDEDISEGEEDVEEEEDEEDEENSVDNDNDDEVEDEEGQSQSTTPEPPLESAARLRHITEIQARRNASVQRRINQRIIAAWEQRHGQDLPPEIEQYLKEQPEQRITELLDLLASVHNSGWTTEDLARVDMRRVEIRRALGLV